MQHLHSPDRWVDNPLRISFRGWTAILARAVFAMDARNLSVAAAGVAFYAFLSIFPALGLLAGLLGLFLDPVDLRDTLLSLRDTLPPETHAALEEHIGRLLSAPADLAGTALIVSTLVGLWSTNAAMRAIMMALNIAYRENEQRSLLHFHLSALAMTAASVLFVLGVFGILAILPIAFSLLGIVDWLDWVLAFLRWPLLALLAGLALATLYAFGPSRRQAKWRWLTLGAAVATAAWLGTAGLYSIYITRFANVEVTFGSLGAVAGLMMWFYLSAYCTLFGAVLNAETELQTARDTTVGPPRPMGSRGAYVADHVAD